MIIVDDIMTKSPMTLSRLNNLSDARALMTENRFRHIPIVDESNILIGLVTQRNVLAHGIASQDFLEKETLATIERGTLLEEIMTTDLVTISPTMKIADAAHLIHKYKYGCLPVVNKSDQLVGIITDHDFVGITIQLLEMMDVVEPIEDSEF